MNFFLIQEKWNYLNWTLPSFYFIVNIDINVKQIINIEIYEQKKS
jgi:hypothetical protein